MRLLTPHLHRCTASTTPTSTLINLFSTPRSSHHRHPLPAMGKRARAVHRAGAQSSSRSPASTVSSRQQHDQSIDTRMDAITAQSKYSQPRITRVQPGSRANGRGGSRGRALMADDDVPEDEIDQFHRQRDFVHLDSRHDDDEVDEDEEELANARVLDLPDGEEEEAEEEGEDGDEAEDDEEGGGADDAFAPLPLDDLLGEDDNECRERALAAERRLTTSWGRNKRLYYSADTVDFDLESDEDVARAEEEEATRMMKETLQQRLPSDYTLGELLLIKMPQPSASATSPASLTMVGEGLEDGEGKVERVERVDGMSEEEKMELMVDRSPEVLGLLEDIKAQVTEVDLCRRKAERAKAGEAKEWMATVDAVLSMYCSSALVFLTMKGEGKQMQAHPINQQLLALRGQLSRLTALKDSFGSAVSTDEAKEHSAAKGQHANGTKQQPKGTKRHAPAPEEDDEDEMSVDDADEEEEDNEEADEDENEDEEVKEAPKQPAARKADIFSSIPSTTKPSAKSASNPRVAATSRHHPTSLSRFDDLDDVGDQPAVPFPKRLKPNSTLRPTPLPPPSSTSDPFDDDDDDGLPPSADTDALAFYNRLAQQHKAKKAPRPADVPAGPVPDLSQDVVDGKRRIGRLIEKNEGLKPSRPKDRKTPKTRNRARYEKAMVKRRSQVREYQGQGGVYGGEATGIKRNVAKSVRIKG